MKINWGQIWDKAKLKQGLIENIKKVRVCFSEILVITLIKFNYKQPCEMS